jgi:hypothetical protein
MQDIYGTSNDERAIEPDRPRSMSQDLPWIGLLALVLIFDLFALAGYLRF